MRKGKGWLTFVFHQEVGGHSKAGAEMVSSIHLDDSPLSLPEAAAAIRRRCTSECLTNSTDASSQGGGYYNCYPGSLNVPRSPLSLSIDEDVDLPAGPAAVPEMKKDFMTR